MSIFGTDGIRGLVNEYPMTPEIAMKIALILGNMSVLNHHKTSFNRVIVGKDTRQSGYMVEAAMTAGLIAAGADVILTGPVPTPAISMLTKSLRASFGVMISASHNPYEDNGIKIFDNEGMKLSDDTQYEIEKRLQYPYEKFYTESKYVGKGRRLDDVIGRYIEHVKSSIPKDITFQGMKVVLDVANGSAYRIAPAILAELGAEVAIMNNEPNGENINEGCGATFPSKISEKVKQLSFDIGIALDGDGDRLIMCDEKGEIIDGDYIIAAIAKHMKEESRLKQNTVVLTVMSNYGLEDYLQNLNIKVFKTAVGDRNVVQKMQELGACLGGEPSGHIILRDYSKTGDGILSAIQIISFLVKHKLNASVISQLFVKVPQIIRNIPIEKSKKFNLNIPEIQGFLSECETMLNGSGRVLVRKSGTEPLLRLMVEGRNESLNDSCMMRLQDFFLNI